MKTNFEKKSYAAPDINLLSVRVQCPVLVSAYLEDMTVSEEEEWE